LDSSSNNSSSSSNSSRRLQVRLTQDGHLALEAKPRLETTKPHPHTLLGTRPQSKGEELASTTGIPSIARVSVEEELRTNVLLHRLRDHSVLQARPIATSCASR